LKIGLPKVTSELLASTFPGYHLQPLEQVVISEDMHLLMVVMFGVMSETAQKPYSLIIWAPLLN
jgi:hypothetical protein